MRGRIRRALAAGLLVLTAAGCATFPDNGPREWQEQLDGVGELGGIPRVPLDEVPGQSPPPDDPTAPVEPTEPPGPCDDPDPAVVATCLAPVAAIAVLPDGESALVAERGTGRILRVRQGQDPQLVVSVPVDPAGGNVVGLALSPSFPEDQLAYALVTDARETRVVLIAGSAAPRPLLTGIPRGPADDVGALAFDVDGSLLVATGDAGQDAAGPESLAGKVLRIDTRGRPAPGNPDPGSPVLSSGLRTPTGICVNPDSTAVWVTDRAPDADLLYRVEPGTLPVPTWRWPDRPGVGGCTAQPDTMTGRDVVAVTLDSAKALALLRTDRIAGIVGLETTLVDQYGRLGAAALGPDGVIWVGTVNRTGDSPVPTDDRVIKLPPFAQGGASPA